MPIQRFFWKSFASLLSAILLSSLMFGVLLYDHLYESTLESLKSSLKKQTEILAELISKSHDLSNAPGILTGSVYPEDRLTIIALDGTVVADNWADRLGKIEVENHGDRPEVKAALVDRPIFVRRVSETVDQEMLYYAVPIKQDGEPLMVLRLSFPLTQFYGLMSRIKKLIFGMAVLALLFSLPVAFTISRQTTKPIDQLRKSVARIASGDLHHRVESTGTSEFNQLARDLNFMAEELKHKIHSIQQQHSRTEILLSRMVEGVLAIDRNGRCVFANPAFCEMMGLRMERVEGRSYFEVTRNNILLDYISELLSDKQSGQNKHPEAKEVRFFGPDGMKIFSVQASHIYDHNAILDLVLLVFHDITRIKMVEQIRKDFVANVSHELRTPLTALKGSTEVLLDGEYKNPEECKRFLEIMDKQLRNIQNLVNDMLKLAAVEDARLRLRREQTSLQDFVSDITTIVQPLARKKNQQLRANLPDENVLLNVDVTQMQEALLNLLDNAVKYTQQDGIIELRAVDQKSELIFEVKDNGPGIAAEQMPRIFERFYRIDKSRSREMGGTGLGLSIAKHAIENHGGRIEVVSTPGEGTTFTIHLPQTAFEVPSRNAAKAI